MSEAEQIEELMELAATQTKDLEETKKRLRALIQT